MAEFIWGQVKFDNAPKGDSEVEMLSSHRGLHYKYRFISIRIKEAVGVEEGRV